MDQPIERIAFSNSIRLSGTQWLALAALAALVALFAPRLWSQYEEFALEPDYRVPRELSNDYWFFEHYAELAAADYDVLVLGDSAVWGEFVTRQETLSHYLNQQAGRERFANLGLNGAHPLALEGLIEHYGGAIAGKNVLLQCNPTWLRSLKTDLRHADAEVNHERLVPQFVPKVPAYKAEISPRLGIQVERRVPVTKWANHLQQAYYRVPSDTGGTVPSDVPGWTLKHPYGNPLEPLCQPLPESDYRRHQSAEPWFKTMKPQDFDWVDIDESLQWQAFQRTVNILLARGNRVFVLVGPFNEHMMTPASLKRYEKLKADIAARLSVRQIPHLVARPLPSAQYGDASHPLPAGYEQLARALMDEPAFVAAILAKR